MPLIEWLFYGQIMKNHIGFVNDHSGSMSGIARAAMADYNSQIEAVRNAANMEQMDTVVSSVGVGMGPRGDSTERQFIISNPHVLKPVTSWSTQGGTPLWDGIGDMINLFESLPDYHRPEVSFVVSVTTDGDERHSHIWTTQSLRAKIAELQATGRWTFAFRIPRGGRDYIRQLGVPDGNIQEWETTAKGMADATVKTQAAMTNYFKGRSSGVRGSSTFYSDASKVDVSALTDVSAQTSLYVVPQEDMGIQIRDFILKHRMKYLKGSAFYQLTKTESKVSHTKLIAIRQRATGKVFSGKEARTMIGMPTDQNARLHPGDHGEYDIFIQSESVNRKLVAGTGVLYWEAIGVEFTEADLAHLQPKTLGEMQAKPAVVQLPAVAGKIPLNLKPTPSPIPVTKRVPKVNGREVVIHDTRAKGRKHQWNGNKSATVYDLKKLPLTTTVEGLKSTDRWFSYK